MIKMHVYFQNFNFDEMIFTFTRKLFGVCILIVDNTWG